MVWLGWHVSWVVLHPLMGLQCSLNQVFWPVSSKSSISWWSVVEVCCQWVVVIWVTVCTVPGRCCNYCVDVWDAKIGVQCLVVGIPRGVCDQSQCLDWNACNILVLDGLLQPHSSVPSVHIRFSVAVYSGSLFSADSWEVRPISQ